MVHLDPTSIRDAFGRFVPGSSGNPAGKRPGTRNRATILAAALAEGEAETVARVVIDKAVSGDAAAARFVIDRLCPRPRGRAIRLQLPEGESAGCEVVAMFNSALHAMAAGDITPDEAVTVARFLEGRCRVLRAWQMERRMTTYDDQPPIPGDDWVPDEEDATTVPVAPASRRHDGGEELDPAGDAGCSETEEAGGTPALRRGPTSPSPRPEPPRSRESTGPAAAVSANHPAAPPAPLHSACIGRPRSPWAAALQPGDGLGLMSGRALVM